MGKKPGPLASEISAKTVTNSKTPAVAAPQNEAETETGVQPPEEAVRIGAYLRWDAAGRPGGDGVRFWLEAEQELLSGEAPVADKSLQQR